MEEAISMKSTKKEMLKAINEMQKEMKVQSELELNPEKQKEEKVKKIIIEKVDNIIKSDLNTQLHKLKQDINNELSLISEKLENEAKEYENLKSAIQIKKDELKEIYGLENESANLALVLETQIKKKSEFITTSTHDKEELENEISQIKNSWLEEKAALEKERKREKDEYDYNIKRNRELEENIHNDKAIIQEKELLEKQDIFQNEKKEKERELTLRENNVTNRETFIESLEQQVANFPKELEDQVSSAVKQSELNLKNSSLQDQNLLLKGFEGEKNVYEAKINALNIQVVEQAKLIEKLSKQQESAYEKVQEIANKAVSSVSERANNIILPSRQEKE
jgi:uncharacterized coiled-coil protein SlyX